MSQNKGLGYSSGSGPSNTIGTSNLEPLRFQSGYCRMMEISPDRSTARKLHKAGAASACGNRPIRVHEKVGRIIIKLEANVCLHYVGFEQELGLYSSFISIGVINVNPFPLGDSIHDVSIGTTVGYRRVWLKCPDNEKVLHFYVNEKGEVHYGINGKEKGVILTGVDTSKPMWIWIQLFGYLREVKLVDPETSDGVTRPNQNQVEDGVRRSNQNQVDVGVKRQNQNQVNFGVRHPNRNQVDGRVRGPNQSQVEDIPNHSSRDISSASTLKTSGSSNLQSLRFHSVHSNEIAITPDKFTARILRHSYYGALFSDRPVGINEKVRLRLINTNERNTGTKISFGFTNADPALAEWVPSFLSPRDHQYSARNGYWIQLLKLEDYDKKKIFHFYVNEKGEVHYGINEKENGVTLSGINTGGPLWAVIQSFGGLREMKLVDPETLDGAKRPNQSQVKDGARRPNQNQVTDGVRRPNQNQVTDGVRRPNQNQVEDGVRRPNQNQVEDGVRRANQNQVTDGVRRPNQNQVEDGVRRPNQNQVENNPLVNRIRSLSVDVPTSRYQDFVPLRIHRTKGQNIKRYQNNEGTVARINGVPSKSYVFSAQPMSSEQTIMVKIIATEQNQQGSLTIGLTSCDPITLTSELADYSLQDRPEYWVIYPAEGLEIDEELAMTLTRDGKMQIRKTSSIPIAAFHVDTTIKLWAFINIYGNTKTVKILISKVGIQKKNQRKNQKRKEKQQNTKGLGSKTKDENKETVTPSTSRQALTECTICLEDQINCVVYKCGHMCMCYRCAVKQWKGKGSAFGRCPLCRGVITDVIRTYIP